QALEAVRHLEALLEALATTPAPVLRSHGLGVLQLRRLSRLTGLTEAHAALLLEVGYAAGLVAESAGTAAGEDQRWLPTPGDDDWRATPLARRWAVLARAWFGMTRAPGLVGTRDENNKDKPVNALSYEVTRLGAVAARRAALTALAALPE